MRGNKPQIGEESLRAFFEYNPDAVYSLDPEGRFVYVNPAFKEMSGYTEKKLLALESFHELLVPEKTPKVEGFFRKTLAGFPQRFHTAMFHKSGRKMRLDISTIPTFSGGKIVGLHGIAKNITGKKRISDALKESNERFIGAFEYAPIGMAIADLDGKFLQVNDALCRMIGYTEKQLLKKTFEEITHPDDVEENLVNVKKLLEGRISSFQMEKRYIHSNGHAVWILLNASVVRDSKGGPAYFIAEIEDLTERKKTEEELEKSEKSMRAIIKTVGEGIVLMDADSRICMVNEELCNIFGYSESELVEKNIQMLMPEKYCKGHAEGLKKYLDGAFPSILGQRIEIEGLHKDGRVFPIELRVEETRIGENGQWFFTGAMRDITERKRVEKELLKAKETAEEATKLKDKFVSLISHNLRTPLASMLGFLKLIRDGSIEGDDAKKALNAGIESGNKMVALIEELLNISRLKTGKIKLKYTFLDAYFLAAKTINEYGYIAEEKRIKLVNKIPEKTRIYADMDLFHEALKNLLSNAIKFCGEGDEISFFIPHGKPSTIAVSDTGAGTPPELIEHLFSYEVETTVVGTAGERGTGLGLPLCGDIMKAHGGRMYVESEVNKGSTFYAELPHVRPRAMIVEDEIISRKSIGKMLKDLDIEILTAENGEKALEMIKADPPHLMLVDLVMPRMDGFELLDLIKSDDELKKIAIIIITAHGEIKNREKAFRLGADDFITKPVAVEELIPRIRKHLV